MPTKYAEERGMRGRTATRAIIITSSARQLHRAVAAQKSVVGNSWVAPVMMVIGASEGKIDKTNGKSIFQFGSDCRVSST